MNRWNETRTLLSQGFNVTGAHGEGRKQSRVVESEEPPSPGAVSTDEQVRDWTDEEAS